MRLNNERVMNLKTRFPLLISNQNLVYLDNASTTQKPQEVIDIIKKYYERFNANVNRGVYNLSQESTILFEKSRKITAKFINAKPEETIFTKGTTESLNFLSYTIDSIIEKGKDEIIISPLEHHSNLIPWQQLAKRNNMKLLYMPLKKDLTLDLKEAKKLFSEKTALVSISHISNTLGTIQPIEKIIKFAKKVGAYTIIDAAQSTPRKKIDVKKLDCDFLAFSGHKMMGPTGIGVLYGKEELLKKLRPFQFGGGMIDSVELKNSTWTTLPEKFEAGTPDIAGAIGLAKAVSFIQDIEVENIVEWEEKLTEMAIREMKKIPHVIIYGKNNIGIISFNVDGVHPHDVASIMNDNDIAIRGGHHCAIPLMKEMEVSGTCRISFYLYNTLFDVRKFIETLKEVVQIFKNGN